MSDEIEVLTVGEFSRSMKSLEGQITRGFDGVHKRLDSAEDLQREHAERIAVLEAQTKSSHRRASGIGGVVAGAVVGVIEIAKSIYLGSKP